MTTTNINCTKLDYTEEDYENIYKTYEILSDIYETMTKTGHDTWDLENISVSGDDVYYMLRVLEDMKHYNVLR